MDAVDDEEAVEEDDVEDGVEGDGEMVRTRPAASSSSAAVGETIDSSESSSMRGPTESARLSSFREESPEPWSIGVVGRMAWLRLECFTSEASSSSSSFTGQPSALQVSASSGPHMAIMR